MPPPAPTPWSCLESVRGLAAVAAGWQAGLGEHYRAFSAAFLRRAAESARLYPCPRGCGCAHEVVRHADGSLVGVCRCDVCRCDPITLGPADIVVWELSWSRLGRALCQALGLEAKLAELDLPNTCQIGSWSAAAVPAILTLQTESRDFQFVAAALAARLRRRFILLAPTSRWFDAHSQEILATAEAACFDLVSHVRLTAQGTLQAAKTPGELFARFQPEIGEPVEEDVARRAFAVVKALDAENRAHKAPLLTVFRLYCTEGLSAAAVARKCHCGRTLIFARLRLLHRKLGVDPAQLRRYSPQFERIEESLSNSRARRLYRRGAIYGEEEEQE